MQSYDRKYTLSVIEQVVTTTSETTSFPLSVAEGWSFPYSPPSPFNPTDIETRSSTTTTTTTASGTGVLINDLHMRCTISSSTSTGNNVSTTIKIYNASETTRNKLEVKNAYVILEAGYGDLTGLIFTGNIISYDTEKEGNDVVTTLVCAAAELPIKTARTSISYSPQYKSGNYGDLIRDIVGQMKANGVAEGVIITDQSNVKGLPSPENTPIYGGYSFQGYVTQLLDKLCEQFDYTWYITLNELYIHPKYYNSFGVRYELNDYQVKSLRPAQSMAETLNTIQRPDGLKVVTMLDYRMKVGESIQITFGKYEGTYKILEVSHSLSYDDGGEWDTLLSLEAV